MLEEIFAMLVFLAIFSYVAWNKMKPKTKTKIKNYIINYVKEKKK